MDVHEYQAKGVLEKYGIKVPPYGIASSKLEAEKVVKDLDLEQSVVKIQVHAGGRGKAGGVKIAKTPQEAVNLAEQLIGMKMVNRQTGPEGVVAEKVMISPLTDIKKEYYVAAVIDRENARPILIVSPEGGMEIEEVAERTPEKILKTPIGLDGTVKGFHLNNIAKFMGWSGNTAKQGIKMLRGLAKAFMDVDASLLEINPLIETPEGEIVALDAKLSVDENALFRQKDLAECYDPTQRSANEAIAKKNDLAYIALDGDIGCMVNGAGLAMATMDIIQHYGGKPANFLDVGGGATQEKVTEAFKIILSDEKVTAILVNIFGGIMNCATIAEGILGAMKELELTIPLVVRLEGTNVENGRRILEESGVNIISANGMADAAQKVVAAAKGETMSGV
ncbi:MAG: ADP-forming succinate--CoA ligase subunit beta [Waddliaceae bacterium]|nr:ADP-forming succinate--CoA ligase subunit beta [Waddliaceae bacterium]